MPTAGEIKGPSHEKGGIPITVKETGQNKWVEGGEYIICSDAIESPNVHHFTSKTNKEILDAIHAAYNCPQFDHNPDANDFIVCKLTVDSTTKRDIKGTVQRILDVIQAEKGCTVGRGSMSSAMRTGGPVNNTKTMTTTEQELQKAVSDLHKAETMQKMMKDTNAIIRSKKDVTNRLIKEAGLTEASAEKVQIPDRYNRVGFPTYSLTNNNANIKRLKDRVKMLEGKVQGAKAADKGEEQKYTFENGTIEVNYDADRVQIFFDDRPTAEQKNDLKRNGWHWSPTNTAWQRKITPQAIRNAEYIMKATKVAAELKKGIEVEQEHKETLEKLAEGKIDVKEAIKETAESHIEEDPEYYEKLAEIEKPKAMDKKYVRVKGNYMGASKDSIGEVLNKPNMFVTEIYFGKNQSGEKLIKKLDNNYIEKWVGPVIISTSGKSETFIAGSEAKTQATLTKAVQISNEIIGFCEQSDLPKPERELSNKGHTVYLVWPTEKIEVVIDAGSPVADGIFMKKNNFMVENYKLSALREVMLKIKELFKKEPSNYELERERQLKAGEISEKNEGISLYHMAKNIQKTTKQTETVLEPNSGDEFDEVIMSKIVPQAGWETNIIKQGNIRRQILKELKGGDEQDRLIEAQRIFEKWKLTQVTLGTSSARINATYKNQYELNKAIELLLTEKGDSHTDYTSDEKNFIRKYSGYGGLDKFGTTGKGGLFEYYTPRDVIEKMWALAYKYGYNNGSVLEPSVATGEFLQFAKPDIRIVGYEISLYSSVICKILYPTAEIHLQAFEQTFIKNNWTMKDNTDSLEKFDLVIGNPPYGDFSTVESRYMSGMGEKDHTKARNYVEYFIRRGLDLLKPKGLLIYIVGAQVKNGGTLFLDSGPSPVKEYLNQNCELLDAYRLPDSIFERTGVTSEIIVLKKS